MRLGPKRGYPHPLRPLLLRFFTASRAFGVRIAPRSRRPARLPGGRPVRATDCLRRSVAAGLSGWPRSVAAGLSAWGPSGLARTCYGLVRVSPRPLRGCTPQLAASGCGRAVGFSVLPSLSGFPSPRPAPGPFVALALRSCGVSVLRLSWRPARPRAAPLGGLPVFRSVLWIGSYLDDVHITFYVVQHILADPIAKNH